MCKLWLWGDPDSTAVYDLSGAFGKENLTVIGRLLFVIEVAWALGPIALLRNLKWFSTDTYAAPSAAEDNRGKAKHALYRI